MSRNLVLLGAAIATGLLLAVVGSLSISNSAAQSSGMGQQEKMQGQANMTGRDSEKPSVQFVLNRKYMDYENGVFRVRAGAGNHIAPLTLFFPNHAEIKVGETVVFYNPTRVQEPHTVTFVLENGTFADFAGPFLIENGTNFTPLRPGANAEPIIMPGPEGKNVIVAVNNRSFSPTVIDSAGNVAYLQPNANYTMVGTEKYVNSGWIWPAGQAPPGFPPIESFAVTFNEEGTYNYICAVHPWMTGDVVVN
ncbi:MAG: cupredoxin domain-containing protein [Nitrososphaera sp.]